MWLFEEAAIGKQLVIVKLGVVAQDVRDDLLWCDPVIPKDGVAEFYVVFL